MKVGDLVKHSHWDYPLLIVKIESLTPDGFQRSYCRCLVGSEYVWFYGEDLEVINEAG